MSAISIPQEHQLFTLRPVTNGLYAMNLGRARCRVTGRVRRGQPPASKVRFRFRKDALSLVESSGRPIAGEVARSLGIAEGTLWNWVRAARDATERAADPDALIESERDELRRLRKKNVELRTDKEILKRAAVCFARETMR